MFMKLLLAQTIIRLRKTQNLQLQMLFFLAFFTFTACSGLRDSASLKEAKCKHKTEKGSGPPNLCRKCPEKWGDTADVMNIYEPWNVSFF